MVEPPLHTPTSPLVLTFQQTNHTAAPPSLVPRIPPFLQLPPTFAFQASVITGLTTKSICNHNNCRLGGTVEKPTAQTIAFGVDSMQNGSEFSHSDCLLACL